MMRTTRIATALLATTLLLVHGCSHEQANAEDTAPTNATPASTSLSEPKPNAPATATKPAPTKPKPESAAAPRLVGPFTHENLAVYLVRGPETFTAREVLTYREAMEKKLLKVHETGTVSELAVENTSGDAEIFLHYGDIVRGGKQDRVLARDMLLAPKSGRVPIQSFCVEQGRWAKRTHEDDAVFDYSNNLMNDSGMRYAIKEKSSQSGVWGQVREAQRGYTTNLDLYEGQYHLYTKNAFDTTSLELTLEHEDVRKAIENFTKAIRRAADKHPDAIGCVIAINGRVETADIYGTRTLFKQLWPRLLDGAAASAIARMVKDQKTPPPPALSDVRAFLADAATGTTEDGQFTGRVTERKRTGENALMIETLIDIQTRKQPIHQTYVRIPDPPATQEKPTPQPE